MTSPLAFFLALLLHHDLPAATKYLDELVEMMWISEASASA